MVDGIDETIVAFKAEMTGKFSCGLGFTFPFYSFTEANIAKYITHIIMDGLWVGKLYWLTNTECVFYYLCTQRICFHFHVSIMVCFLFYSRERNIPFTRTAKLADIEGCILSYSTFRQFCEKKGNDAGKEVLESLKIG